MNFQYYKSPTGILKAINFLLIIIASAVFFSTFDHGWIFFIGTMLVSALLYVFFLLLTYTLGGVAIQKTFYELFMNSFMSIAFFTCSVLGFVYTEYGGTMVATAIFCLFSFFAFSIDIYFSLVNMGAFQRNSPPDAAHPPPPPYGADPSIHTAGSPFSPNTPASRPNEATSPFPPMPSQMDNSQGMYTYATQQPATLVVN